MDLAELDLQALEVDQDVVAGHDLVVHTAAVVHATTSAERALQERVNVDVTRALVAACRKHAVPRLLHVSSTAAVGISGRQEAPADEAFPFNLQGLGLGYAETKREAEFLVIGADEPGFETVVVNPGFMFGRHRHGYRGSEVVTSALGRTLVPCLRGGLSVVHVEDVVDGIKAAAERGRHGERYILSGPNVSFRDVAQTVARLSGRRKLVVTVPDAARAAAGLYFNRLRGRTGSAAPRLYLDRRYAYQYYSSEKARIELGYLARSLDDIVADVLEYLSEP